MPGNEFGALHQAARITTGYLGNLKSKLEGWDRDITRRMNNIKNKTAKDLNEVVKEFEIYEKSIPNLEKQEAKARADKSESREDATNYALVFKKYQDGWDESFIPYVKTFIPHINKFKDLTEMKNTVKEVRAAITKSVIEGKTPAEKAADEEASKTVRMILHDTSFATVGNNLAATDAPKKRYKLKKPLKPIKTIKKEK